MIYHLWDKVPGHYVEEPVLTRFSPEVKKTDAAVLVFSGGGYTHRAKHEGEGFAEMFRDWGMEAFLLSYRVAENPDDPPLFPAPLIEARRAMRFLRANAKELGIDGEKISVIGSSAGGHLAAFLSTYRAPLEGEGVDELDAIDPIPNLQILCYPVISADERYAHGGTYRKLLGADCPDKAPYSPDLIADEKTPPAFIWHTSTDTSVSVTNSYLYAARLRELGVPCEMHVFPVGGHGLGQAPLLPHVNQWTGLLKNHFVWRGYLPAEE
ncbi:MAG: alpha/beta hydrolase [Clostridia bacterium]|nr:alpha/beta hydrolase [Clostridia bacterium]